MSLYLNSFANHNSLYNFVYLLQHNEPKTFTRFKKKKASTFAQSQLKPCSRISAPSVQISNLTSIPYSLLASVQNHPKNDRYFSDLLPSQVLLQHGLLVHLNIVVSIQQMVIYHFLVIISLQLVVLMIG